MQTLASRHYIYVNNDTSSSSKCAHCHLGKNVGVNKVMGRKKQGADGASARPPHHATLRDGRRGGGASATPYTSATPAAALRTRGFFAGLRGGAATFAPRSMLSSSGALRVFGGAAAFVVFPKRRPRSSN